MTRKEEREQAFILVFEKCFRDDSVDDILDDALIAEVYHDSEYSETCFRGVSEHLDEIDALIEKNLSGWTLGRLSKVALSIMRLAVFEMQYLPKVPVGVSINEAVELCKKYATKEDASYINGVLGSISRANEPACRRAGH